MKSSSKLCLVGSHNAVPDFIQEQTKLERIRFISIIKSYAAIVGCEMLILNSNIPNKHVNHSNGFVTKHNIWLPFLYLLLIRSFHNKIPEQRSTSRNTVNVQTILHSMLWNVFYSDDSINLIRNHRIQSHQSWENVLCKILIDERKTEFYNVEKMSYFAHSTYQLSEVENRITPSKAKSLISKQ